MLADSQNYDAKRIEVETWLQRMETRLEIIAPVGHTADVLEAQIREQKVSGPRAPPCVRILHSDFFFFLVILFNFYLVFFFFNYSPSTCIKKKNGWRVEIESEIRCY